MSRRNIRECKCTPNRIKRSNWSDSIAWARYAKDEEQTKPLNGSAPVRRRKDKRVYVWKKKFRVGGKKVRERATREKRSLFLRSVQ